MTTPTIQPDTVTIGRRKFPFTSFPDVSRAYRRTIEELGTGASYTPPCLLHSGKRCVGYVSFNGRVWAGLPTQWKPGDVPLYDPSAWNSIDGQNRRARDLMG